MPWPTDPARRALAAERHRAAQRRRWQDPAARKRAQAAAVEQFADPAVRTRMSLLKQRLYQEHPEVRAQIGRTLRGKKQPQGKTRLDLIRERAEARKRDQG